MAKANKRQQATIEHSVAQAEEAEARESRYPDAIHEDVPAAMEAKAKAIKAQDELYKMSESQRLDLDEETVTLVSPNDKANVVDSNGVEFKDGKAEGVRKSLAEKYVADFEGYSISGGSKAK